ncbi:MAG: hypothetical protein WDN09_02115 [bacterium]
MNAVGEAMRTKAINGTINKISVNTAVKSAIGSQAADSVRTAISGAIDKVRKFIQKSATK